MMHLAYTSCFASRLLDAPAYWFRPTIGIPQGHLLVCIPLFSIRACFKKNLSLHIFGENFLMTSFYPENFSLSIKNYIIFSWFITTKPAFHHCIFLFTTAH